MKKLFWTFLIIFIAAGAAFAMCFAAEGFDSDNPTFSFGIFNGGFSMSVMENEVNNYNFTDSQSASLDEIDIGTISCSVDIRRSENGLASAEYIANNRKMAFSCKIDDDKLIIRESQSWFTIFNFAVPSNKLTVYLPDKVFDEVKISSVSGAYNVETLKADDMVISTTSGDGKYNVFAHSLKLNTVSGNNTITNCTGEKADSLEINSTSGDNSIVGFRTDSFKLSSISGNINISGISGEGKISTTSGNIDLVYAEWTNDLKISAISGDYTITLPEKSGAEIDFDGVSGSVRSRLNGADVSVGKGSTSVVGGANVHRIDVSLTSGDVVIKN